MSKKAGTRSIDTLRTLSHLTLTCYVESIVQQFHSTIHDNLTPGWNGSRFDVASNELACQVASRLRKEGFESFVSHRTVFVFWYESRDEF